VKRWPDAIAIGTAKCGTGSLTFIDCHPEITFRHYEPDFYNVIRPKAARSLAKYKIPKVLPDEYLIEKSPEYMNGSPKKVAGYRLLKILCFFSYF